MRFVNLKTTSASSSSNSVAKPFYYDSVTRQSKWGSQTNIVTSSTAENAAFPVVLNCSKTGRMFEYQDGKSVWLEPEPARKVFVSSFSSIPPPNGVVVCKMNDGTEFLYNTETRESFLEKDQVTALVSIVRQELPQQEEYLLSEDMQGELMEALQFTYGVLYTKHGKSVDQLFSTPIVNSVEQTFLQPQFHKDTLMLVHQGLVLTRNEFEAWKERDFNKWLQALHSLLGEVLQIPKFANEFQGKIPFQLNDEDPFVEATHVLPTYIQLDVSIRIRIFLTLARWMEHSKRVTVRSPEAYYRGECLGCDIDEDEMVWYFPGIAPHRLYSKTTFGKGRWYCFCQTPEQLTSTVNVLLDTPDLLSRKLLLRLNLLNNHLRTTALPMCTLCNVARVDLLGGKCANCIGILPPNKPAHSQDEDSHLEIVSTGEEAAVADDVRTVCSNTSPSLRAKSVDVSDDNFGHSPSLFDSNEVHEKYNEPVSSLDTGERHSSSVSSHEQDPAPLLPNYGTTPAKESAEQSSSNSQSMYVAPPKFGDNDSQQQQQRANSTYDSSQSSKHDPAPQPPAPAAAVVISGFQPATQKEDSYDSNNNSSADKPFTPFTQAPHSSSED